MKYVAYTAVIFLFGACSGADLLNSPNDTTNKIEVTGYLDSSKIKTTTSSPLNSSTEVFVTIIGSKEAATPFAELTAINERSDEASSTIVDEHGSFIVAIRALLGDTINLTVAGIDDATPLETETFEDQPEFPAFEEGTLTAQRSEETPEDVIISLELMFPLETGHLEVLNITNEHYALFVAPSQDEEDEDGLPVGENHYSTQISAQDGDILFIVYNDSGIISDAIEVVAPDGL